MEGPDIAKETEDLNNINQQLKTSQQRKAQNLRASLVNSTKNLKNNYANPPQTLPKKTDEERTLQTHLQGQCYPDIKVRQKHQRHDSTYMRYLI